MSNKITNFVIFTLGVTVGSATTFLFIKRKYEQIAQEEIDSVKEVFSKKGTNRADSTDIRIKDAQQKHKNETTEYSAKVQKYGYTNYSNIGTDNKSKEETPMDKPYTISPEEFGEFDDYETISFIYYADKILTDENDVPVEDIDNVVGFDSLNSFGEYEDDSVFVRNERLKCDYEILNDERTFLDMIRNIPPSNRGVKT